jgi:hypothetical protein
MSNERERYVRRQLLLSMAPVRYSGDAAVQAFVEEEAALITPYSVPEFTKSAAQVMQAARVQFGPARCRDLIVREH